MGIKFLSPLPGLEVSAERYPTAIAVGYYRTPLRGWNKTVKPKTFMLIAGEASGDLLAAELVSALRGKLPDATFFRRGRCEDVRRRSQELAFDLTQHSVIGISDVLKNYFKFRRLFNQLLALAIERKPDVIIGVDYGGFNLRFGHAVKYHVRLTKFVLEMESEKSSSSSRRKSGASRPGLFANRLAADYDLLLQAFSRSERGLVCATRAKVARGICRASDDWEICEWRFTIYERRAGNRINRKSSITNSSSARQPQKRIIETPSSND